MKIRRVGIWAALLFVGGLTASLCANPGVATEPVPSSIEPLGPGGCNCMTWGVPRQMNLLWKRWYRWGTPPDTVWRCEPICIPDSANQCEDM